MLDDVQFVRSGWSGRNRILFPDAEAPTWLTMPVRRTGLETLICDSEIDPNPVARRKLVERIRHAYMRTPWFGQYFDELRAVLEQPWKRLVDLDLALLRLIFGFLDLPDNLQLSSDFGNAEQSDDKVVSICRDLGATVYLANNGSSDYIDPQKFNAHGIGFVFQNYQHPTYDQGESEFVSHLSVLDLLFRSGPAACKIILSGKPANWEADIVS